MPRVVFVISSGRCGTQWLAFRLRDAYPNDLMSEHEPLESRYRSADYYRLYDSADVLGGSPEIAAHVARIRRVVTDGVAYLETGWPAYGVLPMLLEEFAPDIGLVHLVRHPVPTALSLAATIKGWSTPGWHPWKWEELSLPKPATSNVFQRELRDRWGDLSPFEQCLFWWTEVQLYAEELRARFPHVPFQRVRAEDLFAGDASSFERFVSLAGLPLRDDVVRAAPLDEHGRSAQVGDWRAIFSHPAAVNAAVALGYDPAAVDEGALRARYPV